jgi:hypothetical protein
MCQASKGATRPQSGWDSSAKTGTQREAVTVGMTQPRGSPLARILHVLTQALTCDRVAQGPGNRTQVRKRIEKDQPRTGSEKPSLGAASKLGPGPCAWHVHRRLNSRNSQFCCFGCWEIGLEEFLCFAGWGKKGEEASSVRCGL